MKKVTYMILLFLFVFTLLPRLVDSYRFNQAYLHLIDYLPANTVWIEHALFSPSNIHEPTEFGEFFLQNNWPKSKTLSLPELHSPTSLFKTLSLINILRQREELGMFFAVTTFINNGEDLQAIDALSKMRASGVLLVTGRLLLEDDTNRALDYLEVAFEFQPTNYPILRELVDAYLAEERYCDLLKTAQIGVEFYDSGLYYYFLGRAYEGLEVWELAAEAYQKALVRRPNYAPYERLLVRVIQLGKNGTYTNLDDLCK